MCVWIFCLGDEATGGLRLAYLENVADFVRRAKAHGVQVMLTIDALPAGTTWSARVYSSPGTAYDGFQEWFLPANLVAAFRDYFIVLIEALLDAGMPADGVFAYSLINEAFMDGEKLPFSLRSGTRTTANGQTYDLSSATERRRMLEDGLVYGPTSWLTRFTESYRRRRSSRWVFSMRTSPTQPVAAIPG